MNIFILRALKNIWFFSFLRRIFLASRYTKKNYSQILKWAIRSNEYTNFTYDLTDDNIAYMAHTIAVITKSNYKTILKYIDEARNDQDLKDHIIKEIKKSPQRKFADLDIQFGRRLGWYAIVRTMKPKVIIETGVDKGMGSVLMCAALLKNKNEGCDGYFTGTDINPAAGYLLTGKYKEVGKIVYGDSIETLKKFNGHIDVFINDSDHSSDYELNEYLTIELKLNSDGIIIGDNSHLTDKLSLFAIKTNRKFLFIPEYPKDHWFPGAGMGLAFR